MFVYLQLTGAEVSSSSSDPDLHFILGGKSGNSWLFLIYSTTYYGHWVHQLRFSVYTFEIWTFDSSVLLGIPTFTLNFRPWGELLTDDAQEIFLRTETQLAKHSRFMDESKKGEVIRLLTTALPIASLWSLCHI